jgi:hypothetical protein
MTDAQRPRLSVSTWSLHRTLGRPPFNGPEHSTTEFRVEPSALPLLALPARLADFGIRTLEICHFHLPTRDSDYLASLRTALADAGVTLFSLLIDGGDISDPEKAERDLAWTEGWLDTAAALGAANARVSAGKSAPSDQSIARSREGFERLAEYIDINLNGSGLRLMTENWHTLLSTSEAVHMLLKPLDGRVGLCADFGNWSGPTKYDELAAILPLAESCHAKCSFQTQTEFDREDYIRCLDLAKDAGFTGPYTLIYDGPGDHEWLGLGLERDVVTPYL